MQLSGQRWKRGSPAAYIYVTSTITADWETALREHIASRAGRASPTSYDRQVVRLKLDRWNLQTDIISELAKQVYALAAEVVRGANDLANHVGVNTSPKSLFQADKYGPYGLCRELTKSAPSRLYATEEGVTILLQESFLEEYSGPLLVSGPPGYGKTSFCKWSALLDGERFADGRADTLPVYIALHRFAEYCPDNFDSAFFSHERVDKIVGAHKKSNAGARIRVYLDGLDEVPLETQKRVVQLAYDTHVRRPEVQIVVTARDHVTGPWLWWLRRIQIARLSESKVRDLVTQLLANDSQQFERFAAQLDRVPTLRPLLGIPLLCTLTASVFAGMISLPESKAELYRIFVDLLCGGWDVAKGIKRESPFPSQTKHRILIRLASILHARRARTMQPDALRAAIKEAGFVHLSRWEALVGDIVQDGLLTRDGQSYSFAHLSFQEYLSAKDLADPNTDHRVRLKAIEDYLSGDDWWREVVMFYAGMSNRPDQMLSTVKSIAVAIVQRPDKPLNAELVKAQVEMLASALQEMFPKIARQCENSDT